MVRMASRGLQVMEALCLDILHSDWHDYLRAGVNEDRLLKAGWLGQIAQRWGLSVNSAPDAETIATIQKLRALMQRMVRAYIQGDVPAETDVAALNAYLEAIPSRPYLVRDGESWQLRQIPLISGWSRVPGETVISFANLLAHHDPARLKQCENPACRWIFYDESANRSRQWCEDACANLMRVRRFRAHHKIGANRQYQ